VCLQIYGSTGVMPRGLMHPQPLAAAKRPRLRERNRGSGDGGGQDLSLGNFMMRWGAVPVSPKSLVSLLRNGECVLLFPGGADEVRRTTLCGATLVAAFRDFLEI
jgi:hypothetical protein